MTTYSVWGLSLLLCAGALPGCSSDGDSGLMGGATGATGSSTGSIIDVGGMSSGGAGSTTSKFDGGQRELTAAEAKAIDTDACQGWSIEPEALPAELELVIDVSSSMGQTAPGSKKTKWEVTRDALIEAIVGGDGPGLPASTAVGLLFYPNRQVNVSTTPQSTQSCVAVDKMVPINTLGGANGAQRSLIRTSIEQAQLNQSTPTHDAYRYALNQGILPSKLSSNKFMLLITDGEPTLSLSCMNPAGKLTGVDPEPIVDEVKLARSEGVKTFLIGSPGSENNRDWMSRAAVLGDTATADCKPDGPNYCHMDMTTAPDFSQALRDGLSRIAGSIAPCVYEIPDAPDGMTIDQNKINVVLEHPSGPATLIIRDDIGECTQGWQLLSAEKQVKLCSDTCKAVQADPTTTVNVRFGCESLPSGPIR